MHRSLSTALFAIALSPLAVAAQQVPQINTDSAGVAILGYDPVAYFTDARAVVGTPEFTARHEGATWQFASAAHRDAFVANPTRYAPQFGGYCAYGVAGNYKVKIDPEAWRIEDGKLYLNYDLAVQRRWYSDIPGYIARATRNWPGLREGPRKD